MFAHPFVARFNSRRFETCDAADVSRINYTIKETTQSSSDAFNNLTLIQREY